MKILIIESVVLCFVFALSIYIFSRDPIKTLYNYPPNIQERVKSLEQYKGLVPTQEKKISTKLTASLVIVLVFSLIIRYINGCTSFKDAFINSFILWTIVNVFDALVMDVIWFCHDPYFVIKGTEDMVDDYHDYWFHIKQSMIGEAIALFVCMLVGFVVHFVLK